MLYFDTSYLVRLHTRDAGWEAVRALAASDNIACCLHGHAEVVAAFHRKFREGAVNQKELRQLLAQFDKDCKACAFTWLPCSKAVIDRVFNVFSGLSAAIHLRAADALHLACAAENAIKEVHSNDKRLLEGAHFFGVKGINVI